MLRSTVHVRGRRAILRINTYFPMFPLKNLFKSKPSIVIIAAIVIAILAIAVQSHNFSKKTSSSASKSKMSVPTAAQTNLIDDTQFFVEEQYTDFLNREPDASALAFWTNEITS